MTTTDAQLTLRPPWWVRAIGAVFIVFWGYLFFFQREFRGGHVVIGTVVAVVAVVFVVRLLFLSVIGTADGRLTVRNSWSTRTFQRDQVDGVEIDRANGRFGQGWTLWLRLSDGARHRIDVTQAPSRTLFARSLERNADKLRAWLSNKAQPFL